jgi:type VI secretion system ImpM family protein
MERPFLFGKLPALGDFVGRGLVPAQREAWDERCSMTLAAARRRLGDAFDGALEATPPRGFLLTPTPAEPFWQAGCVAPSCDRAGRPFLLVLGMAGDAGWADAGAGMAARLEPCVRAAIGQELDIDAIVDAMAGAIACDATGEGGGIKMMAGWCTDWIGAPEQPAPQERDE